MINVSKDLGEQIPQYNYVMISLAIMEKLFSKRKDHKYKAKI